MIRFIFKNESKITLIAFMLIASGLILRFSELTSAGNIALIAATIIAMVPIGIKAYQAIIMKLFSIEMLVSIAVIGALLIGEYVESSVVTFLFLFGGYLEARTLEKTRSSIKELTDMAPQEASLILEDGSRTIIDADDVEIGDRIAVLPGGMIPVDGKVLSGDAEVNEAAVSGESVPVLKMNGSRVFSGTILDSGYLEIEAEKVGDDTTFSKIIELVEEAQDTKSNAERFLDRFAQYYTPGVLVLSIIVWAITRDLHLAITFLVIACPGALVIGAPVSNVAGIGNGAKNGSLIKGGEVIEKLSKVDTLVFDKTGTLTKGRPEVTDFKVFTGEKMELAGLIGKLETASEHHLGRAVTEYAEKIADFRAYTMNSTKGVKGRGIEGEINNHTIIAGNRKMMIENGIEISESIEAYALEREKKGNTAIFAAVDSEVSAVISIADKIRDDAEEALKTMRNNGIKHIVMLTGDNRHTAAAVAEELGIDEVHAELLPEDKVTHVKRLKAKGRMISMAGDGINDAPAIATADVGLAMGKGGTDISMETADIVLMADRLSQYAHALSLAKGTMRNMKQNIIIALVTVVILLVGVLMGGVNLAIGMFAHEASVLIVILNAMRLIKFKP
ncbi:haloacid dehalogenase [Jeotgalicoccus coquinae]|uniref:Cd(2+)-exporting ATPase n=1 Tax=Jeotgalicoccus coquinae TaxID=709509 RepID=A0A6V7R2D6_9STAP|nr:cation-translocating P-type ATPase [Jeotgalicoccus coquinae]MBB6423533.1 Cd2+/Zn2+-exporting ATPase [Jeotgalicoccus coquinae]GGE20591.1 haloacid dehalogenase [Jeotgalicoccus coquinae]CAD2071509.1 putative cadmium-transporting ATPase [Jeotgalicoccus coquinae]